MAAGAAKESEPTSSRADDGVVTVEAISAEKALEEVSSKLGPDAQILSANKIQRGGMGGFFAREFVQLTARASGAPATGAHQGAGAVSVEEIAAPAPAADADARMDEAKARKNQLHTSTMGASFEKLLERYITEDAEPDDSSSSAAPAPTASAPVPGAAAVPAASAPLNQNSPRILATNAPVPAAPHLASPASPPAQVSFAAAPGTGETAWSADELVRIQLPYAVIEPTLAACPIDDLDWVQALARTLRRYCGPLSDGPQVYVGPKAGSLASQLGVTKASFPESLPHHGSACFTISDDSAAIGELMKARKGRGLHLVVGGNQWQGLAELGPVAVSWTGRDGLAPALGIAVSQGIPLGYGKLGTRVLRANPLDVALAVRDLVGRR